MTNHLDRKLALFGSDYFEMIFFLNCVKYFILKLMNFCQKLNFEKMESAESLLRGFQGHQKSI